MKYEDPHWHPQSGPQAAGLIALAAAWRDWRAGDVVPRRDRFDPMAHRDVLPWVMLGEILEQPNTARPYDMMMRSIGTELEIYFSAGSLSHTTLSDVGPPFTERWFRILDDARSTPQPHSYQGAPYRTGYDYIPLEMLTLPLSRDGSSVDYVLFALAKI